MSNHLYAENAPEPIAGPDFTWFGQVLIFSIGVDDLMLKLLFDRHPAAAIAVPILATCQAFFFWLFYRVFLPRFARLVPGPEDLSKLYGRLFALAGTAPFAFTVLTAMILRHA